MVKKEKENLVDSDGNIYEEIVVEDFPYTDPKYFDKIDNVLKSNGIVYSGFSIHKDTLTIYVPNLDQETSIRQLIAQYSQNPDKPTPKEQAAEIAMQDAVALLKAIAKKPRNNRTDAEKIMLGLGLYVGSISEND
jgi:hypothetical protein